MNKYIDADRLRAEIDEHQNDVNEISQKHGGKNSFRMGRQMEIDLFRRFVDSLQHEQPEVDLEKEIEEHVEGMPMSEFTHESEVDIHYDWARKEFRYFFELGLDLGLNARKV